MKLPVGEVERDVARLPPFQSGLAPGPVLLDQPAAIDILVRAAVRWVNRPEDKVPATPTTATISATSEPPILPPLPCQPVGDCTGVPGRVSDVSQGLWSA
ncbi:hypothetical protein GCM10018966_060540 [Streptomyces yanii]